ncbi:MAG: GTP cyclohydrolase I FolE [Deltaproteobacteria bacterium]|nr:GTP cyclohydrolase I FolE [Deltaproteobacteria bacterium]
MNPDTLTSNNEKLVTYIQSILEALGEDPNREGLKKTPERFLKSLSSLTSGYNKSAKAVINGATFEVPYSEMVVVKNIEVYSLCEHHLLPFFGKCHVGYLPRGRIVGLSKIPRIVEVFARRLQVQERLTSQISECLMEHLNPFGVGVVVEAYHLCMMMRGVEKQNSYALTSSLLGHFRTASTRKEFFDLIK